MIVDTSAVVCIAMDERNALELLHKLHEAPTRHMSVASAVEACLVLVGRLGDGGRSDLDALLRHLKIELVPLTPNTAQWRRKPAFDSVKDDTGPSSISVIASATRWPLSATMSCSAPAPTSRKPISLS